MNSSLTAHTEDSSIPFLDPGSDLLSVRQMAERLGFSPYTIRKWAREGKLVGQKIGDDWRFPTSWVMEGDAMGRHKKGYKGPKGLIKQGGKGPWYIKWKGIYKSTGTEDLTQAQFLLAQEQQKYWAKEILQKDEHQGPSFVDLIARYLKEESPKKRSARSDIINAKKPLEFWPDKPIDSFYIQDLYQYQDWRKVQYVKPKKGGIEPTKLISGATINRELALVKHAFKKAVRWGYLKQSPFPKGEVEGMSETKRERYITNEEFQNICKTISGVTRPIVQTLYHSAQRSGKIFVLTWRQIDLEHRTITFDRVAHNKRVPELIWINDRLFPILKALWENRKKRAVISPYVFPNRKGRPIQSIKKAWATACKKAGVEDAHVHDIRHKATTDMAKAGIPIQKIQKAVGHSEIETTAGYTHLQIDDVREAFQALE